MAITNQERVGKAMELLRIGLAPFVEREFKSLHQAQATDAARRYFGDDRTVGRKPVADWDVAALLKLMWESWNEVFGRTLGRAERSLVQELGREPTAKEIGERMDLSASKVRKIMKIAQEPISLETPIGEEEDSHLGDFIEDKTAVSPIDSVISTSRREEVQRVMKTLTPREEEVLAKRFGLADGTEHTLEEVGRIHNVTRERIRQIESKALRKLRHPSRAGKLKPFLDTGL